MRAVVPDRMGTGGYSCSLSNARAPSEHGVNTFTAPQGRVRPQQAAVKACADRSPWQRVALSDRALNQVSLPI